MKDRYKFCFSPAGVVIFLIVMLPTFLWLVFPAPNDVLREASATPVVDGIGGVFQAAMIVMLICLKNKDASRIRLSKWMLSCITCIGLYFSCWACYYAGTTNVLVLLGMTIPPCLGFFYYELDRKNYIAMMPTIGFAICHLIYCICNFIA